MRPAVIVSAALHALLAGLALLRPGALVPDALPPIEVVMVQQAAQLQGAAPTPPAAAAAAPPSPAQAAEQAQVPPTAPAPPTPAPRPPAPAINLGNGTQDVDPLSVTGENIRPPAPDSRFRNLPPNYPANAARTGAEGTVQLMVHVTASGVPGDVAVVRSSGHSSLDAAAQEAVLLWRFRPARAGGRPVPFDYALNIRFTLGDRQ